MVTQAHTSQSPDYKTIHDLGYDVVKEAIYTASHPAVRIWTKFFMERLHEHHIFETFNQRHPRPSADKANVVGAVWHRFSAFMPWFLCQASAMVSNNKLRHYVIQTAYEELGARNAEEIHHEMFWQIARKAGASAKYRQRIQGDEEVSRVLLGLKRALLASKSDFRILGMLLGLEIPARENIETVFESLVHRPNSRAILARSRFFRLHRQLEVEHIRLDISIFLRFCQTDAARTQFIEGFDIGLDFWESFWKSVSKLIQVESTGGRRGA